MVDVLNPYEYVLWQQEIDQEGMKYGMFDDLDIYKSMKGTDYQDEIFGRTGNQQQYNVSVSGGNKDTKFSVSYAHNEEKVSCLVQVSQKRILMPNLIPISTNG